MANHNRNWGGGLIKYVTLFILDTGKFVLWQTVKT